jgi:uncharacterized protein (TIGR03118 family)
MHRSVRCAVRRAITLSVCCGLVLMLSGAALAQFYSFNYLTSNIPGKAPHTDTLLANPWGLDYGPSAPFWISDEASGYSTLYNGTGVPQSLQVLVPPSSGTAHGTSTGLVFNGSTEFQIDTWTSAFLFSTLDGTISGWSHFVPSTALVGVRKAGAVYTGLAITKKSVGNFLYAADIANNKVDIYDANFTFVKSFTDKTVPKGFAPFGIQNINGRIFVAYASQTGGTGGFIDIFKTDGTFVKRLAHGAPLNQPWGMALAPSNFGPLSGALLVSNNTSKGTINAFNMTTGALVGTIKNSKGTPITINGQSGSAEEPRQTERRTSFSSQRVQATRTDTSG